MYVVFYTCAYHKLAETDCRYKTGRKWRLHDVAVGIPRRACWFERRNGIESLEMIQWKYTRNSVQEMIEKVSSSTGNNQKMVCVGIIWTDLNDIRLF